MKKLCWGVMLVMLVPWPAWAQSHDYSRGQGYVFLAPGGRVTSGSGSRATLHVGVGGEWFFSRHLGAGADAGYLGAFEQGENRTFEQSWGEFAADLVYRSRARDRNHKTEPFLVAGCTLLSQRVSWAPGVRSYRGGVNFGGGFNHWFNRHVGLRFEVRDSLVEHFNYADIRVGLTFH